MDAQYSEALNQIYDLFVNKIESEFSVDKYSSNYNKLDGELTLLINDNEFYVSFGREVTVIFNFGTKRQEVIPITFSSGKWVVLPYTDWNKSTKEQNFDEFYLNRFIRHFKAISNIK